MISAARPRVTLHFAQSLDGRIALAGARALLSSREGVELAHRARAEHDAVLVGSATVRIDDPELTVRACSGPHPRRVVLASALDVAASARVLASGRGVTVVGVLGRASDEAKARLVSAGVDVCLVPAGADGLVSLAAALVELRARGIERLLVEGGARVLTAFLRDRLADDATIEIAPRFLGAPGVCALGPIGIEHADHGLALSEIEVDRLGPSVVVRGRLAY
jgi:riboflavin-specific deaminase-like protein